MKTETLTLLLSAAVLFITAIAQIYGNWANLRIAKEQREEARRKDQLQHEEARRKDNLQFLIDRMETLGDIRARLQWLHRQVGEYEQQREDAFGAAYALILSTEDQQIRSQAQQVMDGGTRQETIERESQKVEVPRSEQLEAIDAALKRFGDLVDAGMRGTSDQALILPVAGAEIEVKPELF
jgi:hypothetical protein